MKKNFLLEKGKTYCLEKGFKKKRKDKRQFWVEGFFWGAWGGGPVFEKDKTHFLKKKSGFSEKGKRFFFLKHRVR